MQLKYLFLISILFSGCVHQTKSSDPGVFQSYNEAVENSKLNLNSSFAFTRGGHNYYFVTAFTEGRLNGCLRFDGYKDDQLTYSFPYKNFSELNTIYSSEKSIDQKMDQALTLINSISPRLYTCEEMVPETKKSFLHKADVALGDGLSILIYGTMAVIGSPIIVTYLAADYVTEVKLDRRLKKIRLGASLDQVTKIMDSDYEEKVFGKDLVQIYDITPMGEQWKRLIFVFRDKNLIAYVWGLHPR